MKRKSLILSFALSGAAFSTGALQAQTYSDGPRSSVGRIGDGPATIGDGNRYSGTGTMDARPSEFRSNVVEPSLRGTNTYVATPTPTYQDGPVPTPDMGTMGGGEYYAGDMSYEYMPTQSRRRRGGGRVWTEAGALLWFPSARQTPALVSQNATVGSLPSLTGNTRVLAGGSEEIGNDLAVGYRYGLGMWLDDNRELGVGGRVLGLYNSSNKQNFAFDGVQSLGIPFFDTSLGIPNAYVVGIDTGAGGTLTGSIQVQDRLQFLGSELYARRSLIRNGNNRIDVVGGYLYSHLNDGLNLSSTFTDFIVGNLTADGTVTSRVDRFAGVNEFHGGQFGTISEFSRGRWNLSTSTKFGVGNMHQTVRASGTTTTVTPAPGNVTSTVQRGLLTQSSNSGNQSRNTFAFIPQLEMTMGYSLRRNLRAEIGYSFMYFSDVALAGNQIDTNIDQLNLASNPAAPSRRFVTDSLMLHGLNLGVNWSF